MRINISIELRRPARRSVALLLAVVLLGIPAVAVASHQFPDVPTGHPFHGQISAIAEAGITTGFPDGGYHPSDPVTRQAMAAFMQRGFGRVALAAGGAAITDQVIVKAGSSGSLFVPVRELTIDVPGATNSFLRNNWCTFEARSRSPQTCRPKEVAHVRSGGASWTPQTFHHPTANLSRQYAFDVEGLFPASPGPRPFYLEVSVANRYTTTDEAVFALTRYSSLSAQTFPFGSTGGNTP